HTRAVTKFVTAIRGLQTFRRLHACLGCFRLERSPGGPCTHWKSAALSRRTWKPDIQAVAADEAAGAQFKKNSAPRFWLSKEGAYHDPPASGTVSRRST